jgi:hypothetical protein
MKQSEEETMSRCERCGNSVCQCGREAEELSSLREEIAALHETIRGLPTLRDLLALALIASGKYSTLTSAFITAQQMIDDGRMVA